MVFYMSYILVSGQYQNGKDTFSNLLRECLNNQGLEVWNRAAFSDKLKDIVCDIYHVDRDFIEKWKVIDYPPPGWDKSVRDVLIHIGEGLREFKYDIWIKHLLKRQGNLIISDCRYLDEMEYFKQYKSKNIVIWYPGRENNKNSRGEQEIFKYCESFRQRRLNGLVEDPLVDFHILNDGDIVTLTRTILNLVIPNINK